MTIRDKFEEMKEHHEGRKEYRHELREERKLEHELKHEAKEEIKEVTKKDKELGHEMKKEMKHDYKEYKKDEKEAEKYAKAINKGMKELEKLTDEFTKGIAYDPEKELEAGPFRISFLKTEHPVPCFGMRITDGNAAVVYTADTSFSERWIPFSRDADLFIADCNYYAGMDGTKSGHMNSEEAATIAEEAQVKNVMLSHLPQYGDIHQLVTEAKRIYSGNVFLAQEGLVWNEIL